MTTTSTLTLHAATAAELMTANPLSIHEGASLRDALNLFTKKGVSVAPVIDDAGRPVGVVSRSDIIVHDRTRLEWGPVADERFQSDDAAPVSREKVTRVRDLMTPAVFSVAPDADAARVIRDLLGLKVHHLFVVDSDGALVGVISALDVLRHLHD